MFTGWEKKHEIIDAIASLPESMVHWRKQVDHRLSYWVMANFGAKLWNMHPWPTNWVKDILLVVPLTYRLCSMQAKRLIFCHYRSIWRIRTHMIISGNTEKSTENLYVYFLYFDYESFHLKDAGYSTNNAGNLGLLLLLVKSFFQVELRGIAYGEWFSSFSAINSLNPNQWYLLTALTLLPVKPPIRIYVKHNITNCDPVSSALPH